MGSDKEEAQVQELLVIVVWLVFADEPCEEFSKFIQLTGQDTCHILVREPIPPLSPVDGYQLGLKRLEKEHIWTRCLRTTKCRLESCCEDQLVHVVPAGEVEDIQPQRLLD